MKKLWIFLGVALSVLIVYGLVSGPATGPVSGGEAAPALSGPGLDGKTVSLSDYKGKVVLVDFWATWCDACRAELPDLVRVRETLKGRGFEILGASMDDQTEGVARFAESFGMRYPIILLGGERPPRGWLVPGLPTAYLIGRDGTVLNRYIGTKDPDELTRDVEAALAR